MAALDWGLGERTHLLLSFSSVVSLYPQMACYHAPVAPGSFPFRLCFNLSAEVYDPLMGARSSKGGGMYESGWFIVCLRQTIDRVMIKRPYPQKRTAGGLQTA
jgi:hypothetical protein